MKITCTSCQKSLSLDETRLPMKPVLIPCPVCETKLTVDRRTMEPAAPAPVAAPPAMPETPDDEENFGAKALIVGNDHPALREAARVIGFQALHFATPQQARDYFMQEYPPIIMLNPPQVTQPPLADFEPIIGLNPVDRRRAFFILFSENLRTLDGNAAFLYGVNLVVAFKDIGSFAKIYREAHAYHERLYAPLSAVVKAMTA
jgi:hypothetical protein